MSSPAPVYTTAAAGFEYFVFKTQSQATQYLKDPENFTVDQRELGSIIPYGKKGKFAVKLPL